MDLPSQLADWIGLVWLGFLHSAWDHQSRPTTCCEFQGPSISRYFGSHLDCQLRFLILFFLHEVYPKQPAAVTEKKAIAAWRSRRFRGRLSAVWAQGSELKGIRYEPLFDYFKGKACALRAFSMRARFFYFWEMGLRHLKACKRFCGAKDILWRERSTF